MEYIEIAVIVEMIMSYYPSNAIFMIWTFDSMGACRIERESLLLFARYLSTDVYITCSPLGVME